MPKSEVRITSTSLSPVRAILHISNTCISDRDEYGVNMQLTSRILESLVEACYSCLFAFQKGVRIRLQWAPRFRLARRASSQHQPPPFTKARNINTSSSIRRLSDRQRFPANPSVFPWQPRGGGSIATRSPVSAMRT